jgi:hypothetical protein
MVLCAAIVAAASSLQAEQLEFFGEQIGLRARMSTVVRESREREGEIERDDREIVLEFYARDGEGKFRAIALSPTHLNLVREDGPTRQSVLWRGSDGPFQMEPSFLFLSVRVQRAPEGSTFIFRNREQDVAIEKSVFIPVKGRVATIRLSADYPEPVRDVRYFLNTYAFAPGGARPAYGAKPDVAWMPQAAGAALPNLPAIVLQHGSDAMVLAPHRPAGGPMSAGLSLLRVGRGFDAPWAIYGFVAPTMTDGFALTSRYRPTEAVQSLRIGMDLILSATAQEGDAMRWAAEHIAAGHFSAGHVAAGG